MRRTTIAAWTVLLWSAGVLGAQAARAADGQRLEDSVLRLTASTQVVDRTAPWQFEEVQQQQSLGVVLDDGRILTSAFAVADATLIEGQKFGASRKIELVVIFADYEVNLAVLRPADGQTLAGLRAMTLGDDLELNDKVDIFKARDSYQLSRIPASLQEVGIYSAVTSAYSHASYLLKAQQTGLGWAEPVVQDGRLVGLATGQDANYVYATPMSIVRHFLEDKTEKAAYRGFPSIGVTLTSLTSPDQRRLLKADAYEGGVRIAAVSAGGSFSSLLKVDDVILECDGEAISEHGFFSHPKWGKVHLKYLLNRHYAGDSLKLKVLRDGQVIEIEGVLERFDSNRFPVVTYRYGEPEPHLIFGGLIFQELSRPFLKQWGKDWEDLAPLDLLYTYFFDDEVDPDPSRRYIFVNRVLADDVNRGYSDVRNQVVERVNGMPVTSMASLRAALETPVVRAGRAYARIELAREGGEVILAYDGLKAAHKRIAKTYEVPTASSFYQGL
jgi:S1-C subfamily serine protease